MRDQEATKDRGSAAPSPEKFKSTSQTASTEMDSDKEMATQTICAMRIMEDSIIVACAISDREALQRN